MQVYNDLKHSSKKTEMVVKAMLNNKKVVLQFDEIDEDAVLAAHKLSMLGKDVERFLTDILREYSLADIKAYTEGRGDERRRNKILIGNVEEKGQPTQTNQEKEVIEDIEPEVENIVEDINTEEDINFADGLMMFLT